MCLATDVNLTADPGVASSTSARSHTFDEIDREIIFTVILLPSAESFMKGCCQMQANVSDLGPNTLKSIQIHYSYFDLSMITITFTITGPVEM